MSKKNDQKLSVPRRTKRTTRLAEPLAVWGLVNARAFDAKLVAELRTALQTIAMIEEPTWRAAATGDASAAIGLALRLVPGKSSPMAYQLVMTALVACAAEGNTAACIVMTYVLRNRVEVTRLDRQLAASWAMRAVESQANQPSDGAG
jgi:hypothetical protein